MSFTDPSRHAIPERQCPDCGRKLANRAAVRRHRGRPACTLTVVRDRLRREGFFHNARYGPPGMWLTRWPAHMEIAWPGEHRRFEPVAYQVHNYWGSSLVMVWWLRSPSPDTDLSGIAASARFPSARPPVLPEGTNEATNEATSDLVVSALDVDGDHHVDLEVTHRDHTVGTFRLGRRRIWFLDEGRPVPADQEPELPERARALLDECRDAPGFLALEPLHAFRWLEERFPPMEAIRWTRCATSIPSEAAEWRRIEASPLATRHWFGLEVASPDVVLAKQHQTAPLRDRWPDALEAGFREERELWERIERDRREFYDPATRHKFDDWGFRREA